eukprot:TRINITY_DN9839_c0_g1_i11.p1 TRINITY_DN9839_c0_g1~~TRINITY_DN9839_c0_g1_i11.p1  ORF type:complete len:497 (+),score=66.54 TRINITY_DN9839_c0_g1_i11:103-1491(+)
MKQTKREKMLEEFEQNKTGAILFCTDVAARGLDIPDVHWIVQFDPPQDPSAFVHRAGRTARMGRSGDALVYLLPSELDYVEFLSVRKVPMEEQAKFEVRQAVNCNQNDEVGEVGQGLKEQNLTENQDGNESIDEIDENKSVDSMDIKESQIVQNVQDSQQRDRSNQKNRKKKGKMQLFQTDKEDSQDQQETSQKFGNQLGCGKEVNSLDMSSQQNHFNGLQGKKKIDNLSPKVLVQNQHIQGKDQSQFQDIDAQFLAQRDRDVMEKGRKAFVAFVRGYKEHYCRFIFRLEELDAVKLGKAFGLLQLPRMREIKRLKNVKEFQSFDVDLDAISYKDKVREKQRKKGFARTQRKRTRNFNAKGIEKAPKLIVKARCVSCVGGETAFQTSTKQNTRMRRSYVFRRRISFTQKTKEAKNYGAGIRRSYRNFSGRRRKMGIKITKERRNRNQEAIKRITKTRIRISR